jgi:hypothetical protein
MGYVCHGISHAATRLSKLVCCDENVIVATQMTTDPDVPRALILA